MPAAAERLPSEEELLLTRSEAEAVLTSRMVSYERIVRVEPEAILYLRKGSTAMTAWLLRKDGRVSVKCESGWPATPAAHLQIGDPVFTVTDSV